MKIRKRETISPIYVLPGDVVTMTVREETDEGYVRTKIVSSDLVDRPMAIDTTIIFDLEGAECDDLGLSDGIGGVFGVSK